jgi:hypothetical protein
MGHAGFGQCFGITNTTVLKFRGISTIVVTKPLDQNGFAQCALVDSFKYPVSSVIKIAIQVSVGLSPIRANFPIRKAKYPFGTIKTFLEFMRSELFG